MKLLMFAALTLGALIPGQAMAQRWVYVAGNDKSLLYIDDASFERRGDKIVATTLSGFARPISGGITNATVKVEYDCAANSFRSISFGYYDNAGGRVGEENSDGAGAIEPVKPGSLNEVAFNHVCRGTAGTPVDDPFAYTNAKFGR